jgi:hypothetical protein
MKKSLNRMSAIAKPQAAKQQPQAAQHAFGEQTDVQAESTTDVWRNTLDQVVTPQNVIQLQRVVGNQAVLRMLQGAPQGSVQRAPEEFGMRTKDNISSFAKDAVAFWKDDGNKDKPLKDYATHIIDKANAMLIAKVTSSFVAGSGDMGSFDRTTWAIKIDTQAFSTSVATTKVGQLTSDEAAEIADTIYHEARHSQQYFTGAQIMAGEGKTKAQIVSALSIPAATADSAVTNKITADKKNGKMIEAVKDWMAIGAGAHAAYKGWVNGDLRTAVNDYIAAVADVDATNLDARKTTTDTAVTEFKKLQKNFQDHADTIKAQKDKSPGDKRVFAHCTKIANAINKFVTYWEGLTKHKVSNITKMSSLAGIIHNRRYAAYRGHLHEEDAWAVGGAVGAAFRSEAKKKKK